jgi:hypothetical protein
MKKFSKKGKKWLSAKLVVPRIRTSLFLSFEEGKNSANFVVSPQTTKLIATVCDSV